MRLTRNKQNVPEKELIDKNPEHYAPAPMAVMEPNIKDSAAATDEMHSKSIENLGRSMRKRGGHVVDRLNLNMCLCGSVVDPSMDGIIKCKRPSCETQWVSLVDTFNDLDLHLI